jgi:plasmid stability protein
VANITVSVPDDVYRAARIRAAERDTSVSALVAEFLGSLSAHEAAEREAKFAAQWEEVRSKVSKDFKMSDNLSREELYDRAARRAEADEARERALR